MEHLPEPRPCLKHYQISPKNIIKISQTLINVFKNMKTSELLSLCPMIEKFHLDIEPQLQFTLQIHKITVNVPMNI